MPNTKSAAKRVRSNERKRTRNQMVKSGLKTYEKNLNQLIRAGKFDEAASFLNRVNSVLDKSAKGGVIHASRVNRKKSRLAIRLAVAKETSVSK